MSRKIFAGYARADMTPKDPVPLSGYGNTLTRISQGVLDPLMATCIAVTDEKGGTVVLFTLDIVATRDAYCMEARQQISSRYGVPVESVVICATHTHSAPDMVQNQLPEIQEYSRFLVETLTELAGQALADRKEAELLVGKTYNEGMNYVRHYIQENGAVCGDNYGDHDASPYRCHVSEADREIRLVKFRRKEGKDILLVNWQAHPNLASTSATEHGQKHRPYITADYVGSCRDYVEANADVHFAFFLGAAGNLNSRSRIETEVDTRDHVLYGQKLGDYVLACMEKLQSIEAGPVAAATQTLPGRINHTEDHLLPDAQKIRELWVRTNDAKLCMKEGAPYGIHSGYHAGAIIGKSQMGDRLDMDMGAGRIGGIGMAFLPYEVFDTNGMYIRKVSPFDMTLIFSCANGGFNYIPSREGFAHGCYEADMCRHAPGTAEEAADLVVSMLHNLSKEV